MAEIKGGWVDLMAASLIRAFNKDYATFNSEYKAYKAAGYDRTFKEYLKDKRLGGN